MQLSIKQNWVKASWVMEATGWNKEKVRKARLQKVVSVKKYGDGYLYDLNSIHPSLIKNNTNA